MLRSHKMRKITLFGPTKDREQVLQRLHKLGVMQLIDLKNKELPLGNALPTEDVREISDLLLRISHINSILRIAPVKQTFGQKIFGLETTKKARVQRKEKALICKEANAFLERHHTKALHLEKSYEQVMEELAEQKEYRQVIRLLVRNNIPTDVFSETKHIRFTVGKLPVAHAESLKAELFKELKGRVHVAMRQDNKKYVVLVIISLQEEATTVNFIVKKYGLATFAFRKLPPSEKPMEWIEGQIAKSEEKREQIIGEIRKLQQKILDETIFLREELELLKERFEAVHKIRESKSFFVLQGWVTQQDVSRVKLAFRNLIILEEAPDEEVEPPVKLSNPSLLKPFEMLTELYALPKYRDLDPTFIVAPLFLIYAGFMLTDFVYGFGLLLLGGIIWLLFRKHDEGMTHISISIFLIGAFSMLFGLLTGSYLGDAPKYFFGIPTAALAVWKDPLADPLYFLIISLFVGLLHLNIGLILGTIEDVRKKKWKMLLSDRVIWWLLQLAILAYVIHFKIAGHILLGMTLLLVLLLQGPLGLLGMTGFMGDVISYSRLFALALSTAGIAMTVNLLSNMLVGVPYVGFILAAIVFIAGHLFSFAMNALGSFVHSIRLQFVEFFGKFYEGGGDTFTPFHEERIYTEVRE